jgi:hypothetical protein
VADYGDGLRARTGRQNPIKVVINEKALRAWLDSSPGAQAGLLKTALAVQGAVVEAAPHGKSLSWPWRKPIRHGWFKESIHVRRFRNGYRVYSRDSFAHLVEFGSVKNPAYAPFRRVLRAFNAKALPNTRAATPTSARGDS